MISPNILIVDDSMENLVFLNEIISTRINANLILAQSGEEALKKTHKIDLALAILDVQMPVMNGYDLALRINEERFRGKIPVIFLTANNIDEIELFKGYVSGAVDYLFNKFDINILLSKVTVFLDLFIQKQIISKKAAELKQATKELTRVNTELIKSEEKYRRYIDNAPDAVFVLNEDGEFLEVNQAACLMSGYSENELLKMSISDILQKEFVEYNYAVIKEAALNGLLKLDLLFNHKDGTERWGAIEYVKLTETMFLCFTKDITERKNAEKELRNSLEQLHELTQYAEKVRENERVAISRELHDDLGQSLTAVKMDLNILRQTVSDKEAVLKINKVTTLVNETIKTVQKLTSQLRPQIIEDLGLIAAIEWYTHEFAQRNSVEILLDMDSEATISPDAALTVFRIMQESLTNISRHARATHIDIALRKIDDYINFKISDNGIGITKDEIKSRRSFGIMSMKERAVSLGGDLDIYNNNGHGTVINLNFPLIQK